MSTTYREASSASLPIRIAGPPDTAAIHAMLLEAAQWVDALGVVMWEDGELAVDKVAAEVASGQFAIATIDDEPAGAIRFQTEDLLFWPDIPQQSSAFVHRLVVARRYKGRGVAAALLQWSVDRARAMGKSHLRLDCDANRPKLRALYESAGFRLHSFRHVGPYYVSRYEYPL